MSDKKSQNITSKPKRKNHAKELRDQKIIMAAAHGKTAIEIAKEFGMERRQVGKVLSSEQALKETEKERLRMYDRADAAYVSLDRCLLSPDERVALEAAKLVFKSIGVSTEKLELEHSKKPKPTVIDFPSGKKIKMGVE
jgi:hypothetical protein